jgi:hypothetical protein
VEDVGQKPSALIPLTSLQGGWKRLSGDTLLNAYHEARSATQNLVDRYSMYEVRQIINLLRTGQSLDAAMLQKLTVSSEQFQRQWEQTRQLSMKPNS